MQYSCTVNSRNLTAWVTSLDGAVFAKFSYDPWGRMKPGRYYEDAWSRYGFNGMEKDDDIKGEGNSYDFGARVYDPRTVRWNSLDPMADKYPSTSSYVFALNCPIVFLDPNGKDVKEANLIIYYFANDMSRAQKLYEEGINYKTLSKNSGPSGEIGYLIVDDKNILDEVLDGVTNVIKTVFSIKDGGSKGEVLTGFGPNRGLNYALNEIPNFKYNLLRICNENQGSGAGCSTSLNVPFNYDILAKFHTHDSKDAGDWDPFSRTDLETFIGDLSLENVNFRYAIVKDDNRFYVLEADPNYIKNKVINEKGFKEKVLKAWDDAYNKAVKEGKDGQMEAFKAISNNEEFGIKFYYSEIGNKEVKEAKELQKEKQ